MNLPSSPATAASAAPTSSGPPTCVRQRSEVRRDHPHHRTIPSGVIYACAFVGTNPTIFERVQRGDKRTYRRTGNLIYDRVRYGRSSAVWG